MTPSPRIWKRASPAMTVAPRVALAAEKSVGVAMFTGDVGDVAAACAPPARAIPAAAATTVATVAIRGRFRISPSL
jgi:hypothetical protein